MSANPRVSSITTNHTKTTQTNNPYAYTGRELETNELYYYRARYYNPTLERFISEDPIGFAGGDFNWYRYVLNDPVNLVDPIGLWTFGISFNFTFGAGAGATFGINFVFDSHGNFQIQLIKGAGGYAGLGIGLNTEVPIGYGFYGTQTTTLWSGSF